MQTARRAAQEAAQRQVEDALAEMKQAYESHASALKLIAKSREKLNKLNFHLNSLLPISKIPREILVEIFSHCLCKHESRGNTEGPLTCYVCEHESPDDVLRVLSGVCVYWKSLVQQSPALWKIVPMHNGRERMKEAFTLSGRAPLSIQMHVNQYEDEEKGERHKEAIKAVRSVFKRVHRIEDLTIDGWPDFFDTALEKYTDSRAPILRRLAVTDSKGFAGENTYPNTTFRYIIPNPCPSLRILLLRGFSLRSIVPSSLPLLQELHISGPQQHPPFHDVLSTLYGLSSLKTLSLSWYTGKQEARDLNDTDSSVSDKPTTFPNLRSVKLQGHAWHLLGHLQAPSANISVSIYKALFVLGAQAELQSLLVDRRIPSYFARSLHSKATAVVIRHDGKVWGEGISYEITTTANDGLSPRTISATLFYSLRFPPDDNTFVKYMPISALYGATLSRGIRECTVALKSTGAASSLGLDKSIGWLELMHAMPLLETLRVESAAAAGKAFFRSLHHDSDQALLTTAWPVPFLKKLVLQLSLGSVEDVPGLDYVECLVAAISARKQQDYILEELEMDVTEVLGLVEDDLVPLTLLVPRTTIKCAPPPTPTSPEVETPCGDQHTASDVPDHDEGVDSLVTESEKETRHHNDSASHSGSDTQSGDRKDDRGSACTSESESDMIWDDQSSTAEQMDEDRDSDVEQAIETSDSSTDGES